ALVAEQHVAAARAGDEQIELAVVVVIDPGRADADAIAQADASLLGDVLEGPVALVAEEGALAELVAEEDVVVPVAVEVADGQAATVVVEVDLEGFALLVREEVHAEVEADFLSDVDERRRLLRLRVSRRPEIQPQA